MDNHVCKYCKKEFESGPLLGSHIRSHTRKLIECDICHKQFGEKQIEKHVVLCLEKEKASYKSCEKCNKDFKSYFNRFCSRSCANGHVVSGEQKLKTSNTIKSKFCQTEKHENLLRIEKNLQRFVEKRQDKQCKYCNRTTKSINGNPTKIICTPRCPEFKEILSKKLSASTKGKTGGYRERGGRGHGCHYKGIWLDSTWELALAKKLDALGVLWERDTGKHKFDYVDQNGELRNYFPDFYLPNQSLYIEVKGYWTVETKFKMSSVKKRHKHISLLILESIEEIENLKL
ncbi:MAG: hypothetical protein EBU90_24075 [Proteobacteria bacterium]|nr:hypothetical protein [Pseudomonadota bacterium]